VAWAQQTAPDQTPLSQSEERIRAALERQPSLSVSQNLFTPAPSHDFHLGALTFVPPETRGQFIAVSVPIGDMAMRAVRSVAIAQQHRGEQAARAEVVETLTRFKDAGAK
jgi:hypothetical protein